MGRLDVFRHDILGGCMDPCQRHPSLQLASQHIGFASAIVVHMGYHRPFLVPPQLERQVAQHQAETCNGGVQRVHHDLGLIHDDSWNVRKYRFTVEGFCRSDSAGQWCFYLCGQ
jgi:hypothetical protein